MKDKVEELCRKHYGGAWRIALHHWQCYSDAKAVGHNPAPTQWGRHLYNAYGNIDEYK